MKAKYLKLAEGCTETIKKNEILPFATTWMDLEGIIFSKMSEKDKYYMLLLM